jgi:DNA-binding transcriptional regulator YiaG
MTKRKRKAQPRMLPQYEIDTLGAPFKVTLCDSVATKVDPTTGEEKIVVPDLNGLINAVVRSRAVHPRKLNGEEIKFIRNALGVKANKIARFLAMTPEHLSRCEAGAKVMSTPSERQFRLFAYIGTFVPEPEDLLKPPKAEDIERMVAQKPNALQQFASHFFTMRILSAFNADTELHFEFVRRQSESAAEEPSSEDRENAWMKEKEREPVRACG